MCPTAFPTPPNFGAAFNMSLARAMGHSFGVELRAFYNTHSLHSLDTWSPTINIARDPRWGRNVEVPSEDPYLTGGSALNNVLSLSLSPSEIYPLITASDEFPAVHDKHTASAQVTAWCALLGNNYGLFDMFYNNVQSLLFFISQ